MGVFLGMTTNAFIPVNCDSSVNTFSRISTADERVSEVSEQACEWSKQTCEPSEQARAA